MEKTEFIRCPICGNKTRDKIREDTILKNFPLFCPKCKSECLIDIEQFHITVIKAPDAQPQSPDNTQGHNKEKKIMEFNEKLQHLRKQHNMTQEQLAEKLYVSRTAVSKWESGKGYPNIESLKCISKVFSVSIDELLSGNELLELAETENQTNINKIYGLIYGALDLIAAILIFMPFFGKTDGGYIRAVTLLGNPDISFGVKMTFYAALISMSIFGIIELIIQRMGNEKNLFVCNTCSVILHAIVIFIFSISRQPYVTAFLFALLMVKVTLILKKSHKK